MCFAAVYIRFSCFYRYVTLCELNWKFADIADYSATFGWTVVVRADYRQRCLCRSRYDSCIVTCMDHPLLLVFSYNYETLRDTNGIQSPYNYVMK